MSPEVLGQVVLAVHVVVIIFNAAGLVVVPVGAALKWSWVRIAWLRLLHLIALAVVAVQAMLGRACFLTDWQMALSGEPEAEPLIARWVNAMIYWPLPPWVFAAAYVLVFAYAVALWWLVPVERRIVPTKD
jgi:hypothetical protein